MLFNFSRQRTSSELNLAIVTPNDSPLTCKAQSGLLETLSQNLRRPYSWMPLIGRYDPLNLIEKAHRVMGSHHFDAILSIGSSSTKAAQQALSYHKRNTPIIFGGVFDPIGEGLVNGEAESSKNLTGVGVPKRNYVQQVSEFLKLDYRFNQMLIVQSSMDLKQHIIELKRASKLLKTHGVEAENLVLSCPEDIKPLLEKRESQPDVIMLSQDALVSSCASQIVEYCRHKRIVLFVSDEQAFKCGADAGYYDPRSSVGSALAQHALRVIGEEKSPEEIPTAYMDWCGKLTINPNSLILRPA